MIEFDSFAISLPSANHDTNQDYFSMDSERGVFVIADGMGGRPGGAHASFLGVEAFLEQLQSGQCIALLNEAHLRKATDAANLKIRTFAKTNKYMAGMGTTLTAVLMDGSKGKIVHIGDGRVYLSRRLQLIQVTKDHTLVSELMARNLLDSHAAEHHPLRHVLSLALGRQEKIKPNVSDIKIGPDELLIMATDGLSKALKKKNLTKTLDAHRNNDAESICRAIIKAATRTELQDDVTVAVVKIVETY